MQSNNLSKAILFGVCVGDSVGLPVQFLSREEVKQNPVKDLQGFGTFNLPPGHWTDDSSLTFCLAETIAEGFEINKLADKFVKWLFNGYWSSREQAYDIGMSTYRAISKLKKGINPVEAGGRKETDNGNGSLMRILPLVLLTKDLKIDQRFNLTKNVSSLTHGHIRSIIACFYYLEYAYQIINGREKHAIYYDLKKSVTDYSININIPNSELSLYNRLLKGNIALLNEDEIRSSGYVVDTLEASVYCLLTTDNYRECVLKGINLGQDTDTIGAISGGLAGLYYGYNDIPSEWLRQIVKKEQINTLATQLESIISK